LPTIPVFLLDPLLQSADEMISWNTTYLEAMMTAFEPTLLADRALIAVTGADASPFLDSLVTNDLDKLPIGDARFAALLSPQGKILFEFFAQRTTQGFLLDTSASRVAELVKRLSLYRLRAKVTIAEAGRGVVVSAERLAGGYADPRDPRLGFRTPNDSLTADDTCAYHAYRIALGVAEGDRDYRIGDTFPHEANYDLFAGVSFTKGCFVGQEVVARMQNKTVVRKRVVRFTASSPVSEGAAVCVGAAEIGRVGSVDGARGLAMLRLDRATEAAAGGQELRVGNATFRPDAEALARYTKSLADRPVIDL
jgi:tRNA-modifying protein YgfZ